MRTRRWNPCGRHKFIQSLSIHRNPTSILNTYILMNCLFSVSYVTSNTIYLYKASSSVIRTKEKRYYNDPLHAPWFILWNDMLLLNTFSGTSSKANQMFYFSWIGGRVEFRGNKSVELSIGTLLVLNILLVALFN